MMENLKVHKMVEFACQQAVAEPCPPDGKTLLDFACELDASTREYAEALKRLEVIDTIVSL